MSFKRKPAPPRPRLAPVPITRTVNMATAKDMAGPQPATSKHHYIRSKTLREAFRRIPCQHCGADDGTVCAAHSNWAEHGKGKSIKADDNMCASLCFVCHSWLDQGAGESVAKRMMWNAAHAKSVAALVSRGLWPSDVPIPKVEAPG